MTLFWLFMCIANLLIPLTMILFGKRFMSNPPERINHFYGYRTCMSMKNKDTWIYAHKYFGKYWFILGLCLLPISLIPLFFVYDSDADTIGSVGGIVCAAELLFLIFPIYPTEKKLRKVFDRTDFPGIEHD